MLWNWVQIGIIEHDRVCPDSVTVVSTAVMLQPVVGATQAQTDNVPRLLMDSGVFIRPGSPNN